MHQLMLHEALDEAEAGGFGFKAGAKIDFDSRDVGNDRIMYFRQGKAVDNFATPKFQASWSASDLL